jgi:hypothetical protein
MLGHASVTLTLDRCGPRFPDQLLKRCRAALATTPFDEEEPGTILGATSASPPRRGITLVYRPRDLTCLSIPGLPPDSAANAAGTHSRRTLDGSIRWRAWR